MDDMFPQHHSNLALQRWEEEERGRERENGINIFGPPGCRCEAGRLAGHINTM